MALPPRLTALFSGERRFAVGLAGLILVYVALMTRAQVVKYDSFGMGFDLGLYEQIIWNTAHGRYFATSNFRYTESTLGQDVTLMHAIVAVPYALFPSAYTLLGLETLAVGLGVLPLYFLARDKLGPASALALSFAYLIYVPLHHLNLYEYQPRAFVLGLVFAMFQCLETGKLRGFVVSALLILTTRVDASLTVAAFGVYALLRGKPRAFGLTALGLGATWFAMVVFVITPRFNTTGRLQYLGWYAWLGHTPVEMALTVLTRPWFVLENVVTAPKLAFLAKVYGELGLLPLLRPDVLLIAGPTLAMCLLSPQRTQWDIKYQYSALLYPLAFIGAVMAIYSLVRLRPLARRARPEALRRWLVGAVVVGNVLAHGLVASPAWSWLKRGPPPASTEAASRLIAMIPAEAGVGASNLLGAHLARRRGYYFFPPRNEFYTDQAVNKADYIMVDVKTDAGDPTFEGLKRDPAWLLVAQEDRYMLFRRSGR